VKLLRDPEFQKSMAAQLATGVHAYFTRTGIQLGVPSPSPVAPGDATTGAGGR
jgi:hypothetical protein